MSSPRISGSVEIGPFGPSGQSVSSRIDRHLARVINHLLHLDYDLIGAYEYAIGRVEDREVKASLRVLRDAHRRAVEELSKAVESLGGAPTHHGDARSLLEKARVLFGTRKGDRGIVEAMAANEETTIEAFRQAESEPGLPDKVRDLIHHVACDESRHRAFYNRVLERFVG